MDLWNLILALSLGLALSAACGFRVFVPLLAMSIGSRAGLIELGESWVWISDTWVLIAFAVATLLEIGAYYIPWLDNLLDTVTTPAAVVAGVIVSAASLGQIEDINPALQWMLAVIGGGGMAGTIQIGSALTRVASTTTTGGAANPVVSTAEAGGAVACSVLAVILPVLAVVLVLVLIACMPLVARRLAKKKRAAGRSDGRLP